jgi:hypothetical protein
MPGRMDNFPVPSSGVDRSLQHTQVTSYSGTGAACMPMMKVGVHACCMMPACGNHAPGDALAKGNPCLATATFVSESACTVCGLRGETT